MGKRSRNAGTNSVPYHAYQHPNVANRLVLSIGVIQSLFIGRTDFYLLVTTLRQTFEADQYRSENVDDGDPDYRIETILTLSADESRIDIDTFEYHEPPLKKNLSYGVDAVVPDWSSLLEVEDLIERHLQMQDSKTRSIVLPVESGHGYDARLGRHHEVDELRFTIEGDELEISAGSTRRGRIPGYQLMIDGDAQDQRNFITILETFSELFYDSPDQDVLHLRDSNLRTDAVPEYINGHFQSSVRTAFRVLEERIRMTGGFDQDLTATNLAQEAFSPDQGTLSFAEVDAERRGWMYLYAGGFLALRNPPSHRDDQAIDQHRAMQILNYVDMLLNVLETRATEAESGS